MPIFDFVTFDCYGTLIDWRRGIAGAFQDAAAEDGVTLSDDAVLAAYAAAERRVERDSYRRYRDVLTDAAQLAAESLGWRLRPERARFLADSLPDWRPFDDTNHSLDRLRAAGIGLGILSNTDDDLIAATCEHFTVDFDLVITAQQVRSYKPEHAHFLAARERLGDVKWLHAAQSNLHDIVPTNALGIPNAWINRHGEAPLPGGTPLYELRDLAALADLLAS